MNENDRKILYRLLEAKKKLYFIYIIKAYIITDKMFNIYIGASTNIMNRLKSHSKFDKEENNSYSPLNKYLYKQLIYLERLKSKNKMFERENKILIMPWKKLEKTILKFTNNYEEGEKNERLLYKINKSIFKDKFQLRNDFKYKEHLNKIYKWD